jgi:hypothetical protein
MERERKEYLRKNWADWFYFPSVAVLHIGKMPVIDQ